MLHTVERGHGTIKQAVGKLRDSTVVRKVSQTHRTHPRTRGYTTAGDGWKVTISVTIHDKMSHLRHKGAGGRQLRYKGNCQNRINEPRIGRTTDFEFEIVYNKKVKRHTTKLDHSKNRTTWDQAKRSKMNEKLMEENLWFQAMPKELRESFLMSITPTKDVP